MQIRHMARQTQDIMVPGNTPDLRPALPSTPAMPSHGPAMIRARDPKGVLHEAPAGTPLPPGWKLER
jgi:hypothetical protein